MNDATLAKFEALRIRSHQDGPQHESVQNSEIKDEGTRKVEQRMTLSTEASSVPVSPTTIDSRQLPSIHNSKTKVRKWKQKRDQKRDQKQAVIDQWETSNSPCNDLSQHSVLLQQNVNPAQHQPSQKATSPHHVRTSSHRQAHRPTNSRLVPPSPSSLATISEAESLLDGQKASLSTQVAATSWTLPTRPRPPAKCPSQSLQAFSSSNASPRDCAKHNGKSTRKKEVTQKLKNSDELIHLPAPEPKKSYLARANTPVSRLPNSQSLLVVLDLNGTLLFRTTRATSYIPRSGLEAFLNYCFLNHSVLIWSSARPHNVVGVCKKVFKPAQLENLLGQWGRDTFGLTPEQYQQRVQVYKDLDTVWSKPEIQSRHPNFASGDRWGQDNTVLIDDSPLKAAAQPFNLVKVPEFVNNGPTEAAQGILEQVKSKLEELRTWDNVSAFIREKQAADTTRMEQGTSHSEGEGW